MHFFRCPIYAALFFLALSLFCNAKQRPHPICEFVSSEKLKTLYPSPLYPSQHENGCRWSDTPNGKAYFQIGIIESPKDIRQFFEKKIPTGYQLKKISDLGDRGIYTESRGYLSVIAVREGSWVLISTVDLLYIKQGDPRQTVLWDIYRDILHSLR